MSQIEYEMVIGLEVHAQLKTNTKLFCSCSTQFGSDPNANTCPVCMGLPGVLPVLNEQAISLATKAACALDCTVNAYSKFDRKQYFYPDLPKGYQISQYDEPYAQHGHLDLPSGERIRIHRIHIEEDAGKLVHAGADRLHGSTHSLVDLNRAGTPLIEIVSEPDIRTSEQARQYVQELRLILQYCDICDGNLEEGSLRCDVNISLRPKGQEEFGTRAEIKNVNSFRSIQRAIEYEFRRQEEILRAGGQVIQETRLWEENKGHTVSMRSKEEANDYRYFPEPDLPPLYLQEAFIEGCRDILPLLPAARKSRYLSDYSLNEEEAYILVEDKPRGDLFDEVIALYERNPKKSASIINGIVFGYLRDNKLNLADTEFTPVRIAEAVQLIDSGALTDNLLKKELLEDFAKSDSKLIDICKSKGLEQITDTDAIKTEIQKILDQFPEELAEYRAGKVKLKGFFVGQVMKSLKGKAAGGLVNQALNELIG